MNGLQFIMISQSIAVAILIVPLIFITNWTYAEHILFGYIFGLTISVLLGGILNRLK